MRKLKLQVLKDKVKRKNYIKLEIKKLILQSIFQNYNNNNIDRIGAFQKLLFFNKKSRLSNQNNVCLYSGRIGGVYKKYNMSRHNIKNFAKFNMLHNTTIKSW